MSAFLFYPFWKLGGNAKKSGQETTVLIDLYQRLLTVAAALLCTEVLKGAVNIFRCAARPISDE